MSRPSLAEPELELVDAYWRAANYLSVGQIYLLDNPLLREPLRADHVKPRLLGHFGTTPGLNFVYAHLNRAIVARDLSMIFVAGPGHGGPGLVANAYLEGTYSERYPHIGEDEDGLRALCRQFSFPGGIPSHVAPETPGSIHEGGELGYALSHAFGAAFDNPELVVACVVGDGEAETGPLATSWHSNKFLNAATDGAVLPILHLNGYKIANPTVLARIPEHELRSLFEGYGWRPLFVTSGLDEPHADAHHRFAAALDEALDEIHAIQQATRAGHAGERPRWPMIVLRTPKGWTGPRTVDGLQVEGTWRSHQVPVAGAREDAAHRDVLEKWLRSYRPEELFDDDGRLRTELRALAPHGERRMSANPSANGGELLADLALPDFRAYAVDVAKPGVSSSEATRVLGGFLRDVIAANQTTFRLFGPDETESNRLGDVFSVTTRAWDAEVEPTDDGRLASDGRVMEVLSEHQCQGWLEGYLLTGRHGLFNCYEAFIHIVDSMFNQHAKWLKTTNAIPWRRPIGSLNYLLSSHVWRQDHNGFSHQDPGFIDHVVNKKAEVIRVYLPPDANCLLSVADHCLRSRQYVNVIVAGKQPSLDYLTMDEAITHCTRGAGIWEWASNDEGGEPDVVLGVLRRHPDARDSRGDGDPPRGAARSEGTRRQRRRPDAAPAGYRASTRFVRRRVRLALHASSAGRVRLPRLSVADPPAHVPTHESRQPARARLQGRGHDDDAVRHGDAERPRPLPPRDRRDRPRSGARGPRRPSAPADAGATARRTRLYARARRRRSGDPRLDVAALNGGDANVLVVNSGSTSLKLSSVDAAGTSTPVPSYAEAGEVAAVGHRIVHGGPDFVEPTLVDDAVVDALRALVELAPLHNAPAIDAIKAARAALPDVPHVAVFDTAFHCTIPDVARTYAIPRPYRDELGIRRYGFHGISVQGVAEEVEAPRLVVCHLGGGSSVTAVLDGCSIDTTMGFTPLEGVPMGSRSGSVDPGALLYLLRQGIGIDALEHELEHESGLIGLAGTDDVRELERSASPDAIFALELFAYRVAQAVGAMAVSLGGLDALVFTGGIGAGSARVRAAVCARLAHLGLQIDEAANARAESDAFISSAESSVEVRALVSREDRVVARLVRNILRVGA